MSQEVTRRIEAAFAAGEPTLCRCEACGSAETNTYRPVEAPESEVKTYCDECADELSDYLIPSEDYHGA